MIFSLLLVWHTQFLKNSTFLKRNLFQTFKVKLKLIKTFNARTYW